MISVVIPAHDEASVIARCLAALCEGADPDELEIIVVANGCRDATAAVARDFPGPIRVVETHVASKTNALNEGDAVATGFPRFYVDADVILPLNSLRETARVLEEGGALVAAPRAEVALQGSSRAVRAFYRVWTSLPYFNDAMVGAGVYGMSREGRERFGVFPEIIADDEFVRRQFARDERACVSSRSFTIVAPEKISGVLAIKTRSRLGRLELVDRFPQLASEHSPTSESALGNVLRRPVLWPSYAVYAFVVLVTRLRARRRFARREFSSWDRDESSRSAASDPGRVG